MAEIKKDKIKQRHDQWCRDNGYPIGIWKHKEKKKKEHDGKINK